VVNEHGAKTDADDEQANVGVVSFVPGDCHKK